MPTPNIFNGRRRDDVVKPKAPVKCWKTAFYSAQDAVNALRQCAALSTRLSHRAESAYYKCQRCGHYHLTSQEQYESSTTGRTL